MESKKEQRKERREERRAERVERRRGPEQEESAWDLGELEPAVVTSEIPSQDGGNLEPASITAKGGPRPIQGKAEVQNPSSGIINRQKPTQAYGGMIEPAVVTAERTQDGGSLEASEISAKGKAMPNIQGRAKEQNPSDIGRMPNPPRYGGELPASGVRAEGRTMPNIQGKAIVQNPSAGIVNRQRPTEAYGGMLDPAVVTAQTAQDGGELPASGVSAEGKEMPKIQGKAVTTNSSDIGRMPNPPKYGGELPASGVSAEGRNLPNLQGKAEEQNPSDIGKMPNPPQYGGELSAATKQTKGREMPNIQGRAEEQSPSDIGKMPNPPKYNGEIASSEVEAESKKINEPKAQAEALTKAGISKKRYEPTLVDTDKQEEENVDYEKEETGEDGGELPAAKIDFKKKEMPTLQAKAEAQTKAGISQTRYKPNQLPEDSASVETTEDTPTAQTAQPKKDEQDALNATHKGEMDALQKYNQQRFNSLGEIISATDARIKEAKQKDEDARRRENAFRYISGLGDTLSSIANLVGTAHGASNQEQHYNSSKVVEKAEEARKARRLELNELSKRLDEMKARQDELKAAGSLKEAQLKASIEKEKAKLLADQRKAEEEKRRFDENLAYRKERDKVEDAQKDRTFEENQRQYNETNTRLREDSAADRQNRKDIAAADRQNRKEIAEADRKNRKEIAEANIAAEQARQKEKQAADPEHQAKALHQNITGIRNELAQKMGYANYNEYLRYKNVSGWGTDIDGQRNKDSRRIRDERASKNPETEEFLDLLSSPENLTEEQVRMLMGASKVLSDAVNSSTTTSPKGGQGGNVLDPNQDNNL
jgi:hypothetical protein